MAWSSQFALTLDLNRAIGPTSIGRVGDAVIKLARKLQSSGSDIVIEQDLGNLFSRFLLDADFVEEFKERTLAVNSITNIGSRIPFALQSGPGPTIQRALREPAFLPMVIHLSMFGATHDFGSFSETLSDFMLRRHEATGELGQPFAGYQPRNIAGTIQACVEQTVGFKWHMLTHRIITQLDLSAHDIDHEEGTETPSYKHAPIFTLAQSQLEASFDLLLAVNRVYRDHTVVS